MMGAGSFLQQVDLDSVSLDGKPGQQEWAEGLAWVKEGGTGVAQNLGREGRALRPVNPQQRDKAKEGMAGQALGCQRLLGSLVHIQCWGLNLGLASERLIMQNSSTSTSLMCSALGWESWTVLGNQGGLAGGED